MRSRPNFLKSRAILPVSLLTCYLALFLILSLLHRTPSVGYETDGVDFMLRVRSIAAGRFIPPAFGTTSTAIYALWLMNRVVPDLFLAAKILAGLSGAIFLLSSVHLARALSERAALLTGILLLANPLLLFYSNSCLSDLLAAAVVTLLVLQRNNLLYGPLLAGLAWGIRPVTIVFLPVLLPAVFKSPAKRVQRAAMATAGFLAGALPQLLTAWRYFGSPFYSENWRNIAAMVRPAEQVNQMHGLIDLPPADLLRILSLWVKRVFADTPEQTVHVIYWAAAFVIPGIVCLWSKYPDRRIWLATSVGYIAVIELTWRVELRYFLPVLPVLILAAVCGLDQLCGTRQNLYKAAAAFLILTTAAAGITGTARLLRLQSPELKQAGEYLKNQSHGDGTVLAASIQSIYYSERPGELLEGLSPQDRDNLAAALQTRNVHWIVADSRLAQEAAPLTWLDDEATVRGRFPNWKAVRFGGDLNVLVWELP